MDEQKYEQQRVDDVIDKIKNQKQHLHELYDQAHQETSQVEKNYVQNAKVNLIEADDRIETHAEIQQQKGLVARAVENETILKRQIDELSELQKTPYFGRIDIQDEDSPEVESLYIGIASFANQQDDFLIYDWRAPISSVYYNGTLGQVTYDTPNGAMNTNLLKKRQFTIINGQIQHMFDTNETVGDELLQQALGQQNDAYMQNIVATIQKEQNDIIRDTKSDLLVVQGVAGSGKTSAILQRIAYLLYHSRAELNADEIVLFSPNRLYSRYISDVLPSLGERNMRQLTLQDFLNRRLSGLKVQSLFERFESAQKGSNLESQSYKESTQYMDRLLAYTDQLTSKQLVFTDINYNGEVFFSKQFIKDIFDSFPTSYSIAQRFFKTKNALIQELKNRIESEIDRDWVQDKIDQISDEKYHDLVQRRHFKSFDDEQRFIGRQLVTQSFQVIDDAIFNDYFVDFYLQYQNFMQAIPEISSEDLQDFSDRLERHQVGIEDAAPLLYLRDLITGGGVNRAFQHVFIDEMQDYTMAQMIYLKHAFPRAHFTLLGDSQQALFKDLQSPEQLLSNLASAFNVKKSNLITLNKSYRSTAQITNFSAALIPNGDQIQAFSRNGNLPKVMIIDNKNLIREKIIKTCQTELENYQTVAVLTKNEAESLQAQQMLESLHPHLINDEDREVPKGIIILPIYLAKGLEFDSVIVFNASQKNYPTQNSAGILYTMSSRAMHHLTLISFGKISDNLKNVNPDLYQLEKVFSIKSL